MNKIMIILATCLLVSCSGGGSSSGTDTPSIIDMNINKATNGIFDPAPVNDGSGTLWMSFSIVDSSSNDPVLPHISTRIARSTDDGLTWTPGLTPIKRTLS